MAAATAKASDNLRLRGDIIQGLQQDLIHGGHSLKSIPETIYLLVEKNIWREFVEPQTGQVVSFESFEEFVTAPPLEGLGSDIRQLKHLCRDYPKALDAINQVTGHNQGRRTDLVSNIHKVKPEGRPAGTTAKRALRKLRKDRPDLHERVLAKDLSPHAAMIEAGFRKKSMSIPTDLKGAARRLAKHFDADELCAAMKEET